MNRFFFSVIIVFVFLGVLKSQNAIIGNGFTGGWDFNTNLEYFSDFSSGSYGKIENANATGNQYFRICVNWGGTQSEHTINPGSDSEVNIQSEISLSSTSTTSGAMYINVSDVSHNYIFKTKDAGANPSFKLIIFKVEGAIRSVTNVSQDKSTVYPGQDVTITATLDGSISPGQGVYLRYTIDNFATSTVVEMSGSGVSFTSDIPASINTATKEIKYYLFTSGNGLSITPENSDWYTINSNNNSGNNYSYTVEAAYMTKSGATTWSSVSSWDAGILPIDDQPVTIEDDLILDMDVSVSELTIKNGVTFNANDGAKTTRTLTIANNGFLTNNGTFYANQGNVEFVGVADITGTLSFYDVGISGKTDFGGYASVINNLTVRSGGYVFGDPPIYTVNSNLIFATNGEFNIYNITTIWRSGSTLGAGVPYNVIVTTTNPLKIYNSRSTVNNFIINEGTSVEQGDNSFTVGGDFQNNGTYNFSTDGKNPLTVAGDFINASTATFALSEDGAGGGDLYVAGDFTDNGTFTHNDRAVFFNGSSQRISGTSETSLGYVFVENDAHVTLAYDKDLNIDHDFTIGDGSKAAGSFIIESTSSGTGSLITGGAVPTTIEVERYIEGWSTDVGKDGWHLLSIPFTSFTVDPSDFKPGNNDDLYYYKEPIDMWINWKTGGTPNSDPGFNFAAGKGYLCSYETGGVKSFSGTLNNTAVVANNLTKDGNGNRTEAGWNMIGNPYPSSILWNNSWGSNINAIAKVYPGTGNYIDVDPVNGIPSTQAFFVQVTATTSLTIPLSARLHSDEAWLKSPYDDTKTLTFKVSGGANSYLDQTRIRFNEEATEEFDHQYDSFKLFGFPNAPQLYTEVQNEPYSTNTYPRIELDRVIDLEFIPGTSGEHQIELIENTCNEDSFVLLDDLFNHVTVDITTNKTYKFDANIGDDSHRFKIRFSAVGIDEEIQKESLQAYMSGDQLHILGEEGRAVLYVFNLQGQQLLQEQVMLNNQYSRTLNLKSGIYLVSLRSQNETKTTKISIR